MIRYYINPKNQALIIYDPEENALLIAEHIKNVRVLTKGSVRMGDFEEDEGEAGQPGRVEKTVKCSICGKAGHNKKGCPDKESSPL